MKNIKTFEQFISESSNSINERRINFRGKTVNDIYKIIKGHESPEFFANGKTYNVPDTDDLRHDLKNDVIFGMDDDGGEHEIKVKDIEFINIVESKSVTDNEVINESASISSVSNKLEKTMLEMKKTVALWKSEKDEAKKDKLKNKLKDLTEKKKQFEKELHDAIEELDKDAELNIDENVKELNEASKTLTSGKFHGKTIKEIEYITTRRGGESVSISFVDFNKLLRIEPTLMGGGKLGVEVFG